MTLLEQAQEIQKEVHENYVETINLRSNILKLSLKNKKYDYNPYTQKISVYTNENQEIELSYKQALGGFYTLGQALDISINVLDDLYFAVESLFDVDFETDEDVKDELQEQAQTALERFRKEIVKKN